MFSDVIYMLRNSLMKSTLGEGRRLRKSLGLNVPVIKLGLNVNTYV